MSRTTPSLNAPRKRLRRAATALTGSLVALALLAPVSQAGLLVDSVGDCEEQTIERPFARWLDYSPYTLVPGGSLEKGTARWKLSSGAHVVTGNEPFYVHSPSDTRSLSLPAGSSATTAPMCVGLEHPTLRFFARESGGLVTSTLSTLAVQVVYEDAGGNVRSLPIGVVPGGSWSPTPPYLVGANLLPLLPGEHTAVAFRFTAVGDANWRIDDVYVDPRMRS